MSEVDTRDLAAAIVTAVNATQPPRQMSSEEYEKSSSNKHRDKGTLKRRAYQNGFLLDEGTLSKDQIEMLNIIKPGIYCQGKVIVTATQDGQAFSAIDIQYANRTPDQRMEFKTYFPSFSHLLASILKEQTANTKAAQGTV